MFTCPRGCRNDEHEDENKTYLGHIGKPESRPRLCKKHFITVLKRKRRMMKGRSSALGRINGRLHHQQLLHASLIPEGGRSVITAAGSLTRALGQLKTHIKGNSLNAGYHELLNTGAILKRLNEKPNVLNLYFLIFFMKRLIAASNRRIFSLTRFRFTGRRQMIKIPAAHTQSLPKDST